MKKVLFLLGLFTLCAIVTFAQDRPKAKAKVAKKPAGWVDDSLLWVKKPVGTATIKKPGTDKGNQTQDKLGNFEIQDLKAPKPTEDKLGNFEIQDLKAPKPTEDKLGNFEIQDVKAPKNNAREAGSGLATGRRTHKPVRRKPN